MNRTTKVFSIEELRAADDLADLTRRLENLKPALATILNRPDGAPCRNRVLGEVSNLAHVLYCLTNYARGVRYG